MKKLICSLILVVTLSCEKEYSKEGGLKFCLDGTLTFSDPAIDGPGWTLQVADTLAPYILLERSIPGDVKKMGQKVEACLEETDVPFRGSVDGSDPVYFYKIVSARKL